MNKVQQSADQGSETLYERNSPDQLALIWTGEKEVIAGSPAKTGSGSYTVDAVRLPADFRLLAAIRDHRKKLSGVPKLTSNSVLLTTSPEFSERTRVLALPDDVLALRNDDLFDWLIDAEREMIRGTDQHPVFETPLSDTACSVTRLPNGKIAMTEVPRQHVNGAIGRLIQALGNEFGDAENIVIETPLRCMVRYYLSAVAEGVKAASSRRKGEATAFLLVGNGGFSYGIWSSWTGLFSEYGFLAPLDSSLEQEGTGIGGETPVAAYLRNAFDQLYLQLTKEKLSQVGLESFAKVVWASDPGFARHVVPLASEFEQKAGIQFTKLDASPSDAVTKGLLLGSFEFGRSGGTAVLPQVNLAHDLLFQFEEEQAERRRIEEAIQKRRRASAAFTLLVAPLVVLGVVLGLFLNLARADLWFWFRDVRAEQRKVAMKDDLQRRKSYEENLKWYQGFVTQVSALRKQQPVGIGLQYDLDSRYPFAIDPTFYISEMKLEQDGNVEIKGLARNKDAVTSFLRSLEFAGGKTSGSKLFENLTYEVQEGVAQTIDPRSAQATLPTMEGSALSGTKLAPGIIGWSIKGRYTPVAAFAPKPTPSPGRPGAKPPPAAKP